MNRFAMLLILVFSLHASADDGFQESLGSLQQKQQRLNQAIQSLGVPLGSSGPSPRSGSRDQEKAALYRIHEDRKALQLPQGRFLFARVVNRLVVGPEGSPTLVEVLPGQGALSGMRLMGVAKQSASSSRLALEFKALLFRSGRSLPLQAVALDESGGYGLQAQVISQKALSVMGAMASSFVSGLAASQQSQTTNAFGFQQTQTTGRNAVLQGLAQTAADQSKRLIEESTSEKPVLIVEPETAVTVLIQEEVRW